jgi:hypothetical protein
MKNVKPKNIAVVEKSFIRVNGGYFFLLALR